MRKDLEVRHCRVLVAVSENGGVAAAARALGLAQSTVSETLLSLERVLGTPVTLRRPGKEATLTAAAATLLPHAEALIAVSETARAVFSTKGCIRLGAVESISSFLLPGPLMAFRRRWPDIDVRITTGLCDDLRKRVRRFELDAALTIEGTEHALDSEGGWGRTLSPAQLQLVASPRNSLARGTVGRADLGLQTFLFADPDGAFNGLLRAWFKDLAHRPRFESAGSIDGVKRGAQNSEAIGVLPNYVIAEELSSGSLIELKVREPLPAIALMLTMLEPPLKSSPIHNLTERIDDAFNQRCGPVEGTARNARWMSSVNGRGRKPIYPSLFETHSPPT